MKTHAIEVISFKPYLRAPSKKFLIQTPNGFRWIIICALPRTESLAMTISICLEGPSAVGKTTVAAELAKQFRATVIPEANELFTKPLDTARDGYFEKQVERWRLSQKASADICVFDGDPFQTFWFGWSFRFSELQSLAEIIAFYRPRVVAGDIWYPSKYFIFEASQEQLCARKNGDMTRTRRNFEKHLAIIEPMKRYFEFMQQHEPGLVCFLKPSDVAETAKKVAEEASQANPLPLDRQVALFDLLAKKLAETSGAHSM